VTRSRAWLVAHGHRRAQINHLTTPRVPPSDRITTLSLHHGINGIMINQGFAERVDVLACLYAAFPKLFESDVRAQNCERGPAGGR
jgi:hypothetical protein